MRQIFTLVFLCALFGASVPQIVNSVESLLPIYRLARIFLAGLSSETQQIDRSPTKFQNKVPQTEKFPCDLRDTRSFKKSTSVHKLRPGDIDVVAAMGDSLTVGMGIRTTSLLELLVEERGKSFTIGGEGDWRTYTTLPNILKVFNPNLKGYSLKTSLAIQDGSELNVAEGAAVSSDLPFMAQHLIKKLKSYKGVNVEEDWKMITIFIGSSDFCFNICAWDDPYSSLEKYRNDITEALRVLRDNLPKTFVNLIPPPHMRLLVELKRTDPICYFTLHFECPCFFGAQSQNKRHLLYDVMTRWQRIGLEVSDLEEFDRDDFAVVVQPFILNYTFPKLGDFPDGRFFSPDCFHFSQRMHGRAANDLWNNMMQPIGNKSLDGNELFKIFRCPSEGSPYIFTKRNS